MANLFPGLTRAQINTLITAYGAPIAHTHTLDEISDAGTLAAQNADDVVITGGTLESVELYGAYLYEAELESVALSSVLSFTAAAATINSLSSQGITVSGQLATPLVDVLMTSADTTSVENLARYTHNSSATPAAGYGQSMLWRLKSSTTTNINAAMLEVLWNTATHASRKADLVLSVYDTAKREAIRLRGGGSAAQIGLFGATPVGRQTALGTTSGFTAGSGTTVVSGSTFTGGSGSSAYTIGDIVLALKNYGLLAA